MRVLFVGIGTEQLNISLLAAILRRTGHTVGLAFSHHLFDDKDSVCAPGLAALFQDDHEVFAQARRFRPDVVCYSALTVTYRWMLAVANRLKDELGVINIFGGVHASAVPRVLLEERAIDFVCVGEGDFALPMLLDRIARGPRGLTMPNVAFRTTSGSVVQGAQMPFVRNLDLLPPFEKDIWEEHVPLRDGYMTMSSRGCPYRCTFCFNNFFANLGAKRDSGASYVRQRTVDHFMEELVTAKRRYGIRYVHILDDIFTIDVGWLKEFAARFRKEIGVPFQCLTHAHFVDEARVAALREAGCVWVQIGVQSIDDDYKKRTLRRSDKVVRIERALELLHAAKISVKTDHIFGLPGETLDSQRRALEFYRRHDNLRRISTYWLTYLPGTQMVDQGLAEGTLSRAQVERLNRGDTTFWHRERNVENPTLRTTYQQYEAAFRLLPYLPRPLRARLERRHLSWVPAPLLKPLGMLTLLGDLALSPDLRILGARYVDGITRHIRSRLGLRLSTAPRSEHAPLERTAWRASFERARDSAAAEGVAKVRARDAVPVS